MSLRSLLRHSMILFLLFMPLVQAAGWEQLLIWATMNRKFLVFWLISLLFLSLSGYFLARKQILALMLAQLFGDPQRELARHSENLNSSASHLLLTWALCPKCLAWWFGLVFSACLHGFYWQSWLTALYFGFFGASLAAVLSLILFLLTNLKSPRTPES